MAMAVSIQRVMMVLPLVLGSLFVHLATAVTDPPLQAVVQNLSQQVSILTAKVAAIETAQAKAQVSVSFHAEISADPTQLGPNATVVFNRVLTNVGHGYDDATGYFRSPVSGTYMFVVNYMGSLQQDLYLCLFFEDTQVNYSVSNGNGRHWDHVSKSHVLQLLEGQRVHLQHCESNTKSIRGSQWSTFSGFLIQTGV